MGDLVKRYEAPRALKPEDVVAIYPALTDSTGTLANWRSKGIGPKWYKVGGRRVVYRPEDIEAYLFGNPILTIDSADTRPGAHVGIIGR
jgi:hypothetical protein